ncbi:MAG TPA: toprim domain-containing protein [Bryobacteraceae bacterium]|nr:toprim domain-containing protein [Bryobacteraceae bacterium]
MISGQRIVKELGGAGSFWRAGKGMCRCPAHNDGTPSLSITERPDRVLVHCFAGCDQRAVIDELRALGLWAERDEHGMRPPRRPAYIAPGLDADELARRDEARAIWSARQPLKRSAAALYLWSRCIDLLRVPPTLGALPGLFNSERNRSMPALIAAIQDGSNKVTAVQRIWVLDKLIIDGAWPKGGSKAPLNIAKKTLGPMGDGAIRLGPAARTIGIAEGLETGLSVKQLYSLPVWVSCGAWRMGSVALPEIVERVIIFADNGSEGEKAALKAQNHFAAQGYAVDIELPPAEHSDFNDVLMAAVRPGRAA